MYWVLDSPCSNARGEYAVKINVNNILCYVINNAVVFISILLSTSPVARVIIISTYVIRDTIYHLLELII